MPSRPAKSPANICSARWAAKAKCCWWTARRFRPLLTASKAVKNVAQKYPDIKIVGQQASRNDRASSLMVTTDMLTANPDVSGIFGMNDPSALGAVLAVEQAGKAGAIKVTGVDGSPEAVEELKRSGSPFIGTATQNPGEMVRQAISLAQDMVDGKHIASPTVLIPSVLVTRDNVDSYPGW